MRRRLKRLVVKASILSLVVNGVLLFAKFRQTGRLGSHDYVMAAASLATSVVLISGIALLYLRIAHRPEDENKA